MATENLLSKLRGRSSDIDHFVFKVVSETMIFRDRHTILRRSHANLRHSLSIDIEVRELLYERCDDEQNRSQNYYFSNRTFHRISKLRPRRFQFLIFCRNQSSGRGCPKPASLQRS